MLMIFSTGAMGTDFYKLQGVLRFALEFLAADNLKGFKMQPATNERSRTQCNRVEPVKFHRATSRLRTVFAVRLCYS